MFTILIRVTTIQMSVSVYDWYRRTIVTTCLLVFSTVWNTLFPCIFQQMETHCFPAFSGRLKRLISFHFPSGSNTLFPWIFWQIETRCFLCVFNSLKHIVSLHFLADWNTLFDYIFRQIETSCFLSFSIRFKHIVSLNISAYWHTLFPYIFRQIQTPCFLVFPEDSNILFPCILDRLKPTVNIITVKNRWRRRERVSVGT